MPSKPVILIAGGAGFLGSHLCDHYIKTHKVVCVDNLSTGRRANVEHLLDHADFRFVEADISQPLPRGITAEKYDVVANLASPASPPHYQRLALETLMVGSSGTHNLLELSRASGARFFHASTSEVYGDPELHPQPESYWGKVNSYGPRSMYDEAKRYAEALIYAYRERYSVSTGIVRIFNTYGPRMDPADGRVVSNFVMQAIQNQPITMYGKGDQTRSFCYVSDLIDGFVRMIESDEEGPINLGNPGEFTMKELAETVIKLTQSQSELTYQPLPQDDPAKRRPDISKAKQLLKWEPKVQLEQGLLKTIEYFETQVTRDELAV
jgi:nucleoside-diphosphate-sugar epimerase